MTISLYAVGNKIEVAQYSFWICKTFFPRAEIPTDKTDFVMQDIIKSITTSRTVKYFINEDEAIQYAKHSAVKHPYQGIYITCPAVFKVELEQKAEDEFQVTQLISAKVIKKNSLIPFQLNTKIHPTAAPDLWNCFAPELKCTNSNFEGSLWTLNPFFVHK